jgi:hypothetical protein
VDRISWDNYNEANNIRLSGRPRKRQVEAEVQTAEQQELFKSDVRKPSVIEGRIGTSERKYGLDRILTKLVETSRTVITIAFFVMNAEKILRLLCLLLSILVSVYILILSLCAFRRHPALLWAALSASRCKTVVTTAPTCGPRDPPLARRKSPQAKFSKPWVAFGSPPRWADAPEMLMP